MNKNMTRLARAAKCGSFAARGPTDAAEADESPARSDPSASEPNPTADRCKSARRDIVVIAECGLIMVDSAEFIKGFDELKETTNWCDLFVVSFNSSNPCYFT